MKKNDPIGIFDSGMGGLTVLKSITDKLPGENIVYFGDTVHLPYGNKSPEAIIKYSLEASDFFMKKNVKLMVVACNTASVYALDALRTHLDIPVIGVVESGVRAAVNSARKSIAVIGTYGTVNSGSYIQKIKSAAPNVEIYSKACPLFVPLVEEGWTENAVTEDIAKIYLSEFFGKIDSIILACTHYPMLKKVIAKVLGDSVSVVDSATEVAKTVSEILVENTISNDTSISSKVEFYVSDAPDNFARVGKLFLGKVLDNVQKYKNRE